MADYAKKTVAELQEILKARSLPHTGKKADLVARLTENDESSHAAEQSVPEAATATAPEPIPAQQPTLTKPIDPVDAPAVPAPPAPSTDPSTTTNSAPAPEAAPAPTFAANLSSSTVQSELEKRKARAARFGASSDVVDEATKAAERAQRFGTNGESDTNAVKGLDEALPERRERKQGGRGGRGGGAGRGGRGDRRDNRARSNTPGRVGERGGVQKKQHGAFTSEKDKLAAEARLKRWSNAA